MSADTARNEDPEGHVKADFHIHTGSDRKDGLKYSDEAVIDIAVRHGFRVLAITNHKYPTVTAEQIEYAASKGLLLIPGVEMNIGWKHVLLLNVTIDDSDEVLAIKDFDDLRRFKAERKKLAEEKDVMVIAPHPFFFHVTCLGRALEENIDVFDAIEYSFFFCDSFNRNKKALNIAERYNKPVVFCSDLHVLDRLGESYCLLEIPGKDRSGVLKFSTVKKAIVAGRIKNKIRVMKTLEFIGSAIRGVLGKKL